MDKTTVLDKIKEVDEDVKYYELKLKTAKNDLALWRKLLELLEKEL